MSAAVLIHGYPPGDHDAVSVSAVLVAPLYLPGHTSGATGWSMRARGRLISLAVSAAVLGAPVRVEHRHAAASCLGQGNGRLCIHEARIGSCQRLGPEIVLVHPAEAASCQHRDVGPHDRFEANVTGFGQQDRTEADG